MPWKVRYCLKKEYFLGGLFTKRTKPIEWIYDPTDYKRKKEAKEARNTITEEYSDRYVTIKFIRR